MNELIFSRQTFSVNFIFSDTNEHLSSNGLLLRNVNELSRNSSAPIIIQDRFLL